MFTICTTDTMAEGSRYIMDVLGRVDRTNLDVMHTVIVPDRASLEAERALLGALGGSFNVQVRTFRRLAADLLPKTEYLSKQAGIMALSAIIKDNKARLKCFTKAMDSAGFTENMYDTICMLKYCRISPERLSAADLPAGIADKADDIALLYRQYVDFTADRFVDSADKLNLLCDHIAETDSVGNGYFYIYDFDNLSAQEFAIVEQLALKSKGVYVACCASGRHRDRYLYLNDIYNGLLDLCRRNGISPIIVRREQQSNRQIRQLRDNLYRYDSCTPVEAGGFVQIYNGATRSDEVYELACRVQKYVRGGGRYRDIYVVTSDVAKYYNAIATVFGQFDIPYFCDRQFVLSDHSYARFVVDYLTLQRTNGRLNNVLNFVKNCLFYDEAQDGDDLYLFENYCLKYNVSYRYDSFDLGADEPYFARADAFRDKFYKLCCDVEVPPSATVEQYVGIVRRLIARADLANKNDALAQKQQDAKLAFESKVTLQVAEKFDAVLVQMINVLASRTVDLDEFIKILTVGLASVKISVIPVYNDCVIFANMAKARKHDIKFLALLGANSGVMPIVKSDCKLLTDSNIDDLQSAGVNVEPRIATENKRERFSLYQLLQEPTEQLYISCALSDGTGALLPSLFVTDMSRLFTEGAKPLRETSGTDENVYTPRQALVKTVTNLRRHKDRLPVSMPTFEFFRNYFAERLQPFDHEKDGRAVRVDRGGELYFANSTTSVSRLSTFFRCPYRYFFTYGLGVKPRDTAQLKSTDLGNILHFVLDNYVKHMSADETTERTRQLADKYFDIALSTDYYRGVRSDKKMIGIIGQLRAESERMCCEVKAQLATSEFTNFATELHFGVGPHDALPPVKVPFEGGSFALVGQIDRVDICGNDFIVIDYKSGASAAEYNETYLYIGQKMQLPIYIAAVRQRYNLSPVGFYYFNIHNNFTDRKKDKVYTYTGRTVNEVDVACRIDTKLRGGKSDKLSLRLLGGGGFDSRQADRLLSREQFDNQAEYALELTRSAGKLMLQGYAAVSPYAGACQYCDYKSICDFNDVYTYGERELTESVSKQTIDDAVKK